MTQTDRKELSPAEGFEMKIGILRTPRAWRAKGIQPIGEI